MTELRCSLQSQVLKICYIQNNSVRNNHIKKANEASKTISPDSTLSFAHHCTKVPYQDRKYKINYMQGEFKIIPNEHRVR